MIGDCLILSSDIKPNVWQGLEYNESRPLIALPIIDVECFTRVLNFAIIFQS